MNDPLYKSMKVVRTCLATFVACTCLALAAPVNATEAVGKMLFVRGLVTAQAGDDGIPRFLSRGAPVYEGDVLTTGSTSFAAIGFVDQGKVTLRGDTVFKVEEYVFAQERESAVLKLFKGGLRALTGLIGKKRPGRDYALSTPVATIGIRGTRYDARLCEPGECENPAPRDVGRVAFLSGGLKAIQPDGGTRVLERGGVILQGDVLETDSGGVAVLVFQDDTRVTLQADSRFAVEEYEYQPETSKGNVVFRFLRGGLRALTGLVARNDRRAFRMATPVATIGIRGTGFDLFCKGKCFSEPKPGENGKPENKDGLFAEVWKGAIEFKQKQQSTVVNEGQKVFVQNRKTPPVKVPLIPPELTRQPGPRPDKEKIDRENLFKQKQTEEESKQGQQQVKKQPEETPDPGQEGKKKAALVVKVEEGEVEVKNEQGKLVLGPGQVGKVGPDEPPRSIPQFTVPKNFMRGVPKPDANPDTQKDVDPCQVR